MAMNNPANQGPISRWWRPFKVLALATIGIQCLICALVWLHIPNAAIAKPRQPGANNSPKQAARGDDRSQAAALQEIRDKLTAELEQQRSTFEAYRDRVQAIESYARIILTGAGFFATLLSFGVWKALDEQRSMARQLLVVDPKN